MKPFNLTVLLFCLVTYGYGRPSNNDESDEITREAKKDKHFQHDNVGELPERQTESATAENVLDRLKSLAHLRMAADTARKTSAADSISREELEALRDLLDRNLQKYQNYDAHSVSSRKRPANDPSYTGQMVQNLQAQHQSVVSDKRHDNRNDNHNNNNNNNNKNNNNNNDDENYVEQMPIRRKIIRRTVFTTPLQGRSGAGVGDANRLYGYGGDAAADLSRINWSSPWADYFPILIKDPLQTMMNSFSEIIEYGPAADICRHGGDRDEPEANMMVGVRASRSARRPEALKRSRRNTAASGNSAEVEKGVLSHVRPFKPQQHAATTTEPSKVYHWATDKPAAEHNGDTGPQIKRLVVRRGGVAIAGPGGIATAGSGGTAIVGPGGSAYSSKDTASGATADAQPLGGGVSMAGYGPQMVQAPPGYYAAYPSPHHQQYNGGFGRSVDGGRNGGTAVLSADGVAYTFPAASRGLTATPPGRPRTDDHGDARPHEASAGREIVLPDGAKLIATGPIVYYNPEPLSRGKKSRKGKKSKSRRDQ